MIKKDKKITLNIKFLLSFYHKNDKHKKTKPKKKTRKNNYISKRQTKSIEIIKKLLGSFSYS